jgi:hypothetical protein
MGVSNENLRHSSASGDAHHVRPNLGLGVDSYFLNFNNALGLQNLLGTDAIRADSGGVHLHGGHGNSNLNQNMQMIFKAPLGFFNG